MANVDALCAMFERMDRAVVEIVLEASGGDPERACDQLLKMAAEQEAAEAQEVQEQEHQAEAPSGDTEQDLEDFFAASGTVVEDAAAKESPARGAEDVAAQHWRKPLPEDFLRLPPGITVARAREEQVRQDEIFAQMLADEGFRAELSRHAEFRISQGGPSSASVGAPSSSSSSRELQAAWNELGEAAKTKFNALATRFRRAAAESSMAAPSSAPHTYSAVQADDNDDDDDVDRAGLRHRKAS